MPQAPSGIIAVLYLTAWQKVFNVQKELHIIVQTLLANRKQSPVTDFSVTSHCSSDKQLVITTLLCHQQVAPLPAPRCVQKRCQHKPQTRGLHNCGRVSSVLQAISKAWQTTDWPAITTLVIPAHSRVRQEHHLSYMSYYATQLRVPDQPELQS